MKEDKMMEQMTITELLDPIKQDNGTVGSDKTKELRFAKG